MAGRFSVEAVFRAVDRITAPVSRMQNRVGRFTRSMARGLRTADRAVTSIIKTIVGGSAKILGTITAITTLSLGAATALNAASVEAQLLADSIQFPVDDLQAIARAVAPAGFQLDNIVDLVEEMNNKLGESAGLAEIGPVTESLAILGLQFQKLKKLSPADQFEAITNAALKMNDAQKAAAAVDILLGGEANKIIGVLRQQGGTLDEIIAKFKALDFATEEGRAGAKAFQAQMGGLTTATGTLAIEIAGLIGARLAPMLKLLTDWIVTNKELIRNRVVEFIQKTADGVRFLIDNFEEIMVWVKRVGKGLAVFLSFAAILKTLVGVMTVVNLVMAANPITLIVLAVIAVIAAFTALVVWVDDVADRFNKLPKIIQFVLTPLGLLINVVKLIKDNWEPLKTFFSNLWTDIAGIFNTGVAFIEKILGKVGDAIKFISGVRSNVASAFSFGDEERADRLPGQMVSPQERTARTIEESRETSTAEVTIRDDTGRAEQTGGTLGRGVQIIDSGAF